MHDILQQRLLPLVVLRDYRYVLFLALPCSLVQSKLWTRARWDKLLPKGWDSVATTIVNREASPDQCSVCVKSYRQSI